MTPNILFFQASATIIPTLLVAAAFTAGHIRMDQPSKGHTFGWWFRTVYTYGLALVLVFFVAAGESTCLRILAYGGQRKVDYDRVVLCLEGIGVIILLAITQNVFSEVARVIDGIEGMRRDIAVGITTSLLCLLVLAYFTGLHQ